MYYTSNAVDEGPKEASTGQDVADLIALVILIPCVSDLAAFTDMDSLDAPHNIRFPESFQRTLPTQDEEAMSDSGSHGLTSPSEADSFAFPVRTVLSGIRERSLTPPRRFSRSNVMRLENILNDVSIAHDTRTRSRSLSTSTVRPEYDDCVSSLAPSMARSESPVESIVKKKKVKMHKCPECHKDFPRPSGLRTHMNMHTKEKPFACTYPGCARTFSVVSNAKRHMRTHDLGIPPDEGPSDPSTSVPYVVGFEAPVVIVPPEESGPLIHGREPLRLRWVSLGSGEGARSEVASRMDLTTSVREEKGNMERRAVRPHNGYTGTLGENWRKGGVGAMAELTASVEQ